MIDILKPLQLNDGTKVELLDSNTAEVAVRIPRGHKLAGRRSFRLDGTRPSWTSRGHEFRLMNVPETSPVDWALPLQTVDGKPVRYVSRTVDERVLVEVTYGSVFDRHTALELRYLDGRKSPDKRHSGDDVINKVTRTTVWKNIYADGTVGQTEHKTEQAARDYTKYGKTRVAVMKITRENGRVVDSQVTSCQPYTRSRENPQGRVGYAA